MRRDAAPAHAFRPPRIREAAFVVGAGLLTGALVLGAVLVGDRRSGDRFDLVRWERDTIAGKWLYRLGAPLRHDPEPDDAIARYFAARPEDDDRKRLEGTVEAAIEGRVDAAVRDLGLRGAVPLPGSVFPPVNIELTAPPRVLVRSPRSVIRRSGTALLRPDLTAAQAVAIEQREEASDPDRSALVVGSGGVAAYPAIVSDTETYADTVATAAHEWTHHYLEFTPLGLAYFRSRDATTINETVADLVGAEVGAAVLTRWGDPTRPARAQPTPTPRRGPDVSAVLRDLRREVDAMLAAGQVAQAEARMEAVRRELADGGVRIRRINQAYFAWYGTYAARADAVDPLGAQLREIRRRAGSLAAFLRVVEQATSRADVEAALARLLAEGGASR